MQSVLTGVSHQATLSQDQTPSAPTSTQHGFLHDDNALSGAILFGDAPDEHARAASVGDAPSGVSSPTLSDRSLQGLSKQRSTNSTSPVDRISLYENASSPSPRRASEFGFKVIPSKNKGSDVLSIDVFPNEVLTHILSHLPPSSLSSMSLVSHRFHGLVTTPHAWRIAFSRYFLGPASLSTDLDGEEYEQLVSQRRSFTRLTALASWRSEYILRTRLLRSLARGKPAELQSTSQYGPARQTTSHGASAVVTYSSQCLYPITHMDGLFISPTSKKQPLFTHGASEQGIASISDPSSGKSAIGAWGISDAQMFKHFADLFIGEPQYGLGSGNMVGMPNVMDVSQLYGMVYGEACPQGRAYFLSSNEKHGRFLSVADAPPQAAVGIPGQTILSTAICSVWLVKSPQILKLTNGLFGILTGSSTGILSAYALGPNPSYDKRFERGEVTARWVLSPGVPIIAINVDENYSAKRHAQRRIWATVLNALGEVFYLADIPVQPESKPKLNPEEVDRLAWATGRSVRWELLELTRRSARPDPFNKQVVDGSYSPRSSSHSMGLDPNQIAAETREIEKFLSFKPKHFRKVCNGWNMRRKLEVDFAGDDHHNAGESIVVINCGIGESEVPSIRRYTRQKIIFSTMTTPEEAFPEVGASLRHKSLFGGVAAELSKLSMSSASSSEPRSRASSQTSDRNSAPMVVEWRPSDYIFEDVKSSHITATTIDKSTFAQVTVSEDPLVTMCGDSAASSQTSTPVSQSSQPSSPGQIPGQRARYLAIGTSSGSVFIWNIRVAVSPAPDITNQVSPIRVICTDSPQVSCLALTALYLVHGGNDGLVQAWDPLASSTSPIRTLNSRFSSRARRRLVQAEASTQGVGENYFAAGAICLDPDSTVLRGIVSLGTHLRYWSYSSSAANQYKSSKRRLRHSQRGHNSSPEGQRFSSSGRGALKDYIASEKYELERQRVIDEKERELLSGRFGVDLLGPGATDDDILAYAQMLSEESYTSDERKRRGSEGSASSSTSSSTIAPSSSFVPSTSPSSSTPGLGTIEEDADPDIAEAIRLSLLDEKSRSQSDPNLRLSADSEGFSPTTSNAALAESSTAQQEAEDLDYALQLSVAEEESRLAQSGAGPREDFPPLGSASNSPRPAKSKGKGKGRALS